LSQVKIQGGASGSDNYTILAPATSTGDKTLTLPTATATLASTDANTFTGVQTFPAGSVSAPAITTTGDTNTGVYFSAADEISFATGGSQRAKIGTADLTITNGNLVIGTSGKGIDFSATSGTGTSELLADYEEGTWTPTFSGFVGTTFSVQRGTYTKVGRLVTASYKLTVSSVGTPTTFLLIAGLPFTILASPAATPSGNIGYWSGLNSSVVGLWMDGSLNETRVWIYYLTAAGTAVSDTNSGNLITSSTTLEGQITYFTS